MGIHQGPPSKPVFQPYGNL